MLLCLACSQEFQPDSSLTACPGCGDRGVPADSDKRVTVNLTQHELRCLLIWAEQWAAAHVETAPSMQKVLYGIADRLTPQVPSEMVLTFAGELTQLREEYGTVETTFPEPPMEAPSD